MNVSLTPQLEAFVNRLVKSGAYQSNSEVLRCALRMLREQEASRKAKLEALRREIDFGAAALDRGERAPAAEVFARLEKPPARKRRNAIK